MKLNPKQLAVCAALVGLLTVCAALPASAAGPLHAAAAIALPTLPWSSVEVESIEPGDYAASMTVGTAQQLSPVIQPSKAAKRANVSFVSDNPNVISVTSDGVAQAVGLGTAHVAATVGDQSCLYTITSTPDESMIVTEMDITLASNTIAVGDTTSLSLAVLPTSAANYADVSLTSSNEKVATVNSFGKVTGVGVGTATITGKVTPSSASQALTFKSGDTKVATVSAGGVITGVATGATSVVVSNGTASSSVTVIVNRTASSSGSEGSTGGSETPDETLTDSVAQAITAAEGSEVVLTQAEAPLLSAEALNALRTSGKTLVVNGSGYTIRLAAEDVKNTSATLDTALTFAADEKGLRFTLNNGQPLPGTVQLTMTDENAAYSRLYLYNTIGQKWQFLNAYTNHTLKADTAGDYLLTNENLRFDNMDWTFFIAGGVVMVGIAVAYIVVKKRYWFW